MKSLLQGCTSCSVSSGTRITQSWRPEQRSSACGNTSPKQPDVHVSVDVSVDVRVDVSVDVSVNVRVDVSVDVSVDVR